MSSLFEYNYHSTSATIDTQLWLHRYSVKIGSAAFVGPRPRRASTPATVQVNFHSLLRRYPFDGSLPQNLTMHDLDNSVVRFDISRTKELRCEFELHHLSSETGTNILSETLSEILDVDRDHACVQSVVHEIVKLGCSDHFLLRNPAAMEKLTLEVDMKTLVCYVSDSDDHDDYDNEDEYDYEVPEIEAIPSPVTPASGSYVEKILKKRVRVAAAECAEDQGQRKRRIRRKSKSSDGVRKVRETDSCGVCLEEFIEGKYVVKLECEHAFHRGCISEWLGRSHFCPLCRFEMPAGCT